MARRVAVFSAECRPERINVGESRCENFSLELAAHCQVSRLAEKILLPIGLSLGSMRRLLQVQRRDAEHLSRALAVGRRDDRCLHVEKTAFLEKTVYRMGESVAYAEGCAESIAAHPQVGNVPQKLQRMPFFLERISRGVGAAVKLDRRDS